MTAPAAGAVALALTLGLALGALTYAQGTAKVQVDVRTGELDSGVLGTAWDCARAGMAEDLVSNPSARSREVKEPLALVDGVVTGLPESLGDYESWAQMQNCRNSIGGPGLATGDVDEDGRPDVVHGSTLYLNTKTGWQRQELIGSAPSADTLTRPAPRSGRLHYAAVPLIADLDNDGSKEIILQGEFDLTETPLKVYRKDGERWVEDARERGLQTQRGYQRGFGLAGADVNADGYLDLVLGRFLSVQESAWNRGLGVHSSPVSVWLNEGVGNPGRFYDATEELGVPSAIANLRLPDEFRGFAGQPIDAYTALIQSVLVSDIDGDSRVDIYAQGDGGQTFLLWQEEDGTFTADRDFPRGLTAMGAAVRDVDGNGLADIFVSNTHSDDYIYYQCVRARPCDTSQLGSQLLLQTSPRVFEDHAQEWGLLIDGWPWAAVWVDLANDTDPELLVTGGNGAALSPRYEGWAWRVQPLHLMQRAGGDLYRDIADTAGLLLNDATASVQPADFDGDGKVDLAVGSFRYPAPVIVYNTSERAGNWLQVQAAGAPGGTGTEGRGAVVTVSADGKEQTQELGSLIGYMSTGAPVAWFGVGGSQTVDIEVYFPVTGQTVRFAAVPVNRRVVVQEPSK